MGAFGEDVVLAVAHDPFIHYGENNKRVRRGVGRNRLTMQESVSQLRVSGKVHAIVEAPPLPCLSRVDLYTMCGAPAGLDFMQDYDGTQASVAGVVDCLHGTHTLHSHGRGHLYADKHAALLGADGAGGAGGGAGAGGGGGGGKGSSGKSSSKKRGRSSGSSSQRSRGGSSAAMQDRTYRAPGGAVWWCQLVWPKL